MTPRRLCCPSLHHVAPSSKHTMPTKLYGLHAHRLHVASLLHAHCLPLLHADSFTPCCADHMWWASSPGRASHPNPEAPRCLPCDFDDSKFDHSKKPFNAPKGCPCTAQLICETDERGIFNQYCDVPKAPMSTYSMHGGAGGIISIGMLRAVSLDYMEKCVKSLYSTGQHC